MRYYLLAAAIIVASLFAVTPTADITPVNHPLTIPSDVPSWTMLAIPRTPTITKHFSPPIVALAKTTSAISFHGFSLSTLSTTTGDGSGSSSVSSQVSVTYSFGRWKPYVFVGTTVSGNENYALSREVGAGLKYAVTDQLDLGVKVSASNGFKTALFQKPSMSYMATVDYRF